MNDDRPAWRMVGRFLGRTWERLARRFAVGAHSVDIGYLERALAGARASADPGLFANTVADLLDAELTGRTTDQRLPALLAEALQSCPTSELALRARLEAQRAHMMYLDDVPEYRAAADYALAIARQSGDPKAISTAVAVRMADPIPHEIEVYARIGAEVSQLPGAAALGALPAVVYAAMATGRRETLDTAARESIALQEATGDRLARSQLELLAAGRAILDADEWELVAALRQLMIEAPSVAVHAVPTAAAIWWAHTSQVLRPGTQPSALSPSTPAHIRSLITEAECVVLAEYGDPDMRRQRMIDLFERIPDPARLPRDFTWSTWQAIMARVGAQIGAVELCHGAVEQLAPFVDQFVVLGLSLPVGPVGWFLADPLSVLGQCDQALDANARAERISRNLGSQGWVAHCLRQRGRLLRLSDPQAAMTALAEASRIAGATGTSLLAKQTDALVHSMPTHTAGATGEPPATSSPDAEPHPEALSSRIPAAITQHARTLCTRPD